MGLSGILGDLRWYLYARNGGADKRTNAYGACPVWPILGPGVGPVRVQPSRDAEQVGVPIRLHRPIGPYLQLVTVLVHMNSMHK